MGIISLECSKVGHYTSPISLASYPSHRIQTDCNYLPLYLIDKHKRAPGVWLLAETMGNRIRQGGREAEVQDSFSSERWTERLGWGFMLTQAHIRYTRHNINRLNTSHSQYIHHTRTLPYIHSNTILTYPLLTEHYSLFHKSFIISEHYITLSNIILPCAHPLYTPKQCTCFLNKQATPLPQSLIFTNHYTPLYTH